MSKSFEEIGYISNIAKSRKPREIAVCTEERGLWFVKVSKNSSNSHMILQRENYFTNFTIATAA